MKEVRQLHIPAPDENDTVDSNIPFRWVDELGVSETKPKLENDGHTFTSVTEMLADERMIEEKMLNEHLKRMIIDPD